MRRFWIPLGGCILAMLAALFLLWIETHASATLFTKEPYLANAGPTAVTVHYETASPGDGVVLFGAGGAMDRKATAALFEKCSYSSSPKERSAPLHTAYLYRAHLTDLAPGTSYRYQVLPAGQGGLGSAARTFRTFPLRPDRVTFIAYGDTRTNPKEHRAVAAAMVRHDPLFILHDGDLVASGGSLEMWGPQFFTPLADVIDHIPIMVTLGNHEGAPANLLRFFDTPGGRTWYSFDCGPVHVSVLDDRQSSKDFLEWVVQDLAASKAPWKIVMYHAPTFNLEGHKSDTGRLTFLPLLEKYGVDVVVTGHSHLYERFVPLVRKSAAAGAASPQLITFITTGGGGASLTTGPAHGTPPILAKTARAYHYCLFTVDAETLHVDTLRPDGAKIDALTITKKGGRYDEAYLAQARPMEEAILTQGVIPLSAPVVESLPTPEKPGTVSLAVRFPGLGAPVALAVRLAESSADAYAIDPVNVEVAADKDAAVRLTLRALKKVAAEKDEKRRVLKPEPRFILTAKALGMEASCETGPVAYRTHVDEKAKAKAAQEAGAAP
ncbi:MAG: metallophosphoesterase family protein [Planctomycetota bacterium]|nr:metallophosphoesterase family protein [Planctomycetota bacterium]